jgi:hypothetical protein
MNARDEIIAKRQVFGPIGKRADFVRVLVEVGELELRSMRESVAPSPRIHVRVEDLGRERRALDERMEETKKNGPARGPFDLRMSECQIP